MRILMVTSVYPRFPGDATPAFIEHLAKALAEAGEEVTVLAPHGTGAAFQEEWPLNQKGTDSRGLLRVRRFPYFFPLSLQRLCYEGGMLVNLKTRPWTKLLLPFFFLTQSLFVLWHWFRFRPDIVHSQSLLPQGLTVALAGLIKRGVHVTTSHGNDVFGLKANGFSGRAKKWVLGRVKVVTANSKATAEALRNLGCPEAKIRLIPAMPNSFEANSDLMEKIRNTVIKERGPVLCFTGRLIEDKGVGDLLETVAQLKEDFPKIQLLLLGDGQDRQSFEELARTKGIRDNCHWAGWVSPEEVPSWMALADVCVVPSRENPGGWKEAQGLVVVEAMRQARPVVATNTGGIPDMIEDGLTGRLVTQQSSQELGQALRELLQNPDSAASLGRNARQKAGQTFSAEAVLQATLRVYREFQPEKRGNLKGGKGNE